MIPTYELLEEGESLTEFTENALSDFYFFETRVLGRDIAPHHMLFFNDFYTKERSVIQAARGQGKSQILAIDYPIFMGLRDEIERRDRIDGVPMSFMITSPKQSQALRVIKDINTLINKYEFLNWLKPEKKERGLTWNNREMDFTNGAKIFNLVYNQNMRGPHLTHCLIDEISQCRDKQIFYSVIEPMLTLHNGHLMAIGTPWAEDDLLCELSENRSGQFNVRKVPAIIEGKATWPSRYPIDKLMKEKERVGALTFSREYLLEIKGTEESLIPTNDIMKAMDKTLTLQSVGELGGGKQYFMGIDLASSPTGDYTVITVVEKVGIHIILRYMIRQRGLDFTGHIGLITDIYKRFKPLSCYVDSSGFGKQLTSEILGREMIRLEGFDFIPKNRMEILTNMARLFSTEKIIIPRANDAFTLLNTDELIKEISSLIPEKTKQGNITYRATTKHDDTIFSLALALYGANKTMLISDTQAATWTKGIDDNTFKEIRSDYGSVWKKENQLFNIENGDRDNRVGGVKKMKQWKIASGIPY